MYFSFIILKEGITKMKNEILYETKYLQLKQTKAPNGEIWYYAHRPICKGAVIIAPVLHTKKGDYLIFLETRRPPMYAEEKADYCIEFPAGLLADIDKNETPKMAIKRELLEETGYRAKKITITAPLVTGSAGLSSEISVFSIADIYDLKQYQEPVSDGGIIIKRHKVHITKVNSWLKKRQKEGYAVSSSVYGVLYFLFQQK